MLHEHRDAEAFTLQISVTIQRKPGSVPSESLDEHSLDAKLVAQQQVPKRGFVSNARAAGLVPL
jgi:hypothetical protein